MNRSTRCTATPRAPPSVASPAGSPSAPTQRAQSRSSRMRKSEITDPEVLIQLNCEPDLPPERQAEVRKAAQRLFGPLAEPVLLVCDQAAAAERERRKLERELKRLVDGPRVRGVVVGINNGRVRVAVAGTERDLARPPELALAIGQTVLVDADGRAVIA